MSEQDYFNADKVKRLFSSPMHMPPEFKSWMVDQMVLNIPDLPVTQAFQGRNLAKQLGHAASAVTATSTSEVSVFSFQLPKGALSQNGRVEINQYVQVGCGDASNLCHVFLYMGGVVVAEAQYATAFLDANVVNSSLHWVIQNRNSHSSQLPYVSFWLPATGNFIGVGSKIIMPTTAIDTTAAQTIECKVRWDSAGSQNFAHRAFSANLYNPVRFK